MLKRYRGFTTVNISGYKTRRLFVLLVIGTALAFILVGAISMLHVQSAMPSTMLDKVAHYITPDTLIMVMGDNIPYLQEYVKSPGMKKMISRLLFELATNMNLKDPRSFLGKELPLFAFFDTEVYGSTVGLDYTQIPLESPPPPNLDQEIEKALKEETDKEQVELARGLKEKKVLVYNSHYWESFYPELPAKKKAAKNPSDLKVNVTQLSKYFVAQLEKNGVGAERRMKLYKSGDAYLNSKKLIQAAMKQNKELTYFVDIHRDANGRDSTTVNIHGKPHARLYFVVGKASKNYEKNFQFANMLNNELKKIHPSLSRGIYMKPHTSNINGEYNQSISPNSILIEVGGQDNPFQEGYRTLDIMARVLAAKINQAAVVNGKAK